MVLADRNAGHFARQVILLAAGIFGSTGGKPLTEELRESERRGPAER